MNTRTDEDVIYPVHRRCEFDSAVQKRGDGFERRNRRERRNPPAALARAKELAPPMQVEACFEESLSILLECAGRSHTRAHPPEGSQRSEKSPRALPRL